MSSRHRSRSPEPRRSDDRQNNRRDRSRERDAGYSRKRSRSPLPPQAESSKAMQYGKKPSLRDKEDDLDAAKPNFANSGKLAAETNTFRGVVLKYNEPPEARKPAKSWRLYVFKGKEQLDMHHISKQSCYLVGRDRLVCDLPIDHPSASKQHAVIQFRQVQERNEFGDTKSAVKPFLIDLESANGTTVNEEKVPESRFFELRSGDVIKFAYSTRDYVLLVDPA